MTALLVSSLGATGEGLALEADPRRLTKIENAVSDLKYGGGRIISWRAASAPTPTGLAIQEFRIT